MLILLFIPFLYLTCAISIAGGGRDSDGNSDALSMSSASGELVSDSELYSEVKKGSESGNSPGKQNISREEFKNSGVDVPEHSRNVIGDADGSPVVVQTGTGIKVLVEVCIIIYSPIEIITYYSQHSCHCFSRCSCVGTKG